MNQRPLRVGMISAINTLPIYWGLTRGLVDFPCQLISGSPAQLNGMLRAGELDVSAISSVEYSLAAGSYLVLPGFSTLSVYEEGSSCFSLCDNKGSAVRRLDRFLVQGPPEDRTPSAGPDSGGAGA